MANSGILQIDKLTMQFGGLVALADVSFTIGQGDIFALIGPNGAGKTTLFNCISGHYLPTSGEIAFRGERITRFQPHQVAARGIGRTFQNVQLFTTMTALENVLVARHLRMKSNPLTAALWLPSVRAEEARGRARALELLRLFGLEAVRDTVASQLPLAVRKRVEIARALALGPTFLMLDEPASGLNPAEKRELAALVRRIRDEYGLTVLLIEHDLGMVMDIADRIAVLDFGKLIALGDPATVRADPEVIRAYVGDEHAA